MSELWKLGAVATAALVRSGEVSAVEVTASALARLAAVNPRINAVVEQFPEEALAAARAVDAARRRGEARGVLCGVPVTVKMNVDQTGHATTNGLRIQKDLIAESDNPVVANLRRAGAVIIGRTNTPAFSLRWFTRNGVHGQTFNPRNRGVTPGGSSGGAAAALASGIGAVAHGTDIAGSIRYPAYACGVHGLRPTLGRVPAMNATGPERHIGGQLMAVSGPLARSVPDLEAALRAMSASDPGDPWWAPAPIDLGPAPGGRKVALCATPEGLAVDPRIQEALRGAAATLAEAGWEVEEVACPALREAATLNLVLWLADMRRAARDAIEREGDEDARFVFAQLTRLSPETDRDGLLDTLQRRAALVRAWQHFLHRYAVLLCPVSAELPFPDQLDVSSPEGFERVLEAQVPQVGLPLMGLPALTVSTGMVGDVPVGVQLVAARFREDLLLRAGAVIEQAGKPPAPIDPA